MDTYGCNNNKIWVCGSFLSDAHGKSFRDKFQSHYHGSNDGVALAVVPDDDFCAAFPGAVVSVKSYDYTAKYDKTWSYTRGWKPNSCKSCDIDLTYKCPKAPPPPPPKPSGCAVCYEWALSECKDSFYSGATCRKALDKINYALERAGQKGERDGMGLDGLWCLV